jgi:hypothetical protein
MSSGPFRVIQPSEDEARSSDQAISRPFKKASLLWCVQSYRRGKRRRIESSTDRRALSASRRAAACDVTADDIESRVCVGCGMCCDGVLYERATVDPGEEPSMLAAGLELIDDGDRKAFRQPCPHSSCGRCLIYQTRFQICRTFECALLRRVQSAELSLAEAQEKVGVAQQLLANVVVADPDARTLRGRNVARARLAQEMGVHSGERRIAVSKRLLHIVALESYLQRWFRHKSEKLRTAGDQTNGTCMS